MPDTPVSPSRRRMLGRFIPGLLLLPLLGKRRTLEAVEDLNVTADASSSTARASIVPPTLSVPRRG
jgi:hypothetical protein